MSSTAYCIGVSTALAACSFPSLPKVTGQDAADGPGAAHVCAPSPTGLQARWRGELNAFDDTGVHDGTLISTQFTAGRHGSAFLFDGVRSAVTADPQDTLWPSSSFSIEAWVMVDPSVVSPATVVEKYSQGGTGGNHSDYAIQIVNSGNPQFQYRTSDMDATLVGKHATVNVVDNSWHHLVGVRDADRSELRLYVDGKLAATETPADAHALSKVDGDSNPITIGAGRASGHEALITFFHGAIDDVAIYFSALDDTEVADIYAASDGICR